MSGQQPGHDSPSRTNLLGYAALLASLLVGFNTLVISCSSERASRDTAQLHQIEEREQFWTEAMRELSDVLRSKALADANASDEGWDVRCRLLAQRTAPFVSDKAQAARAQDGELELGAVLAALDERVFQLQNEFVRGISDEKLVGASCATIYKITRHYNAEAQGETEKAVVYSAGEVPASIEEAIAARQDLIELTPLSSTGWDVDIFWCERTGDTQNSNRNFAEAEYLARLLLEVVQNDGSLKARDGTQSRSYSLGRIRVRMLGNFLQGSPPYSDYAAARLSVWDKGRPEEKALAGLLPDRKLRLQEVNARPTPWYVSVFYCGAGAPPPQRPASEPRADAAGAPAT